jgi:hypothetical protein
LDENLFATLAKVALSRFDDFNDDELGRAVNVESS